jgi:hypothetical protein
VCTFSKDEAAGRGRRIRGIEDGMRWAGICMDVLVDISERVKWWKRWREVLTVDTSDAP